MDNKTPIKIKLIKSLTQLEYDWLPRDLEKGEILYVFKVPTYRCISKMEL